MKIALALRGHERNAFSDDELFNFVNSLSKKYDLHLYMHTWNLSEAEASWRPLPKIRKEISKDFILNYFKEINIKYLKIDDEQNLNLSGRTFGRLGQIKELDCSSEILKKIIKEQVKEWATNCEIKDIKASFANKILFETGCPILGWKKMWHGIHDVIKKIKEANCYYDLVINTRFDILRYKRTHNKNSPKVDLEVALNLIKSFKDQKKPIIFISKENSSCIDNFYIGKAKFLHRLAERFHYNLDDVLQSNNINKWHAIQEKLVYIEAFKLMNYKVSL